MLLVYIGLYTLFLVSVWGLFIVARLHTYKFKNFSPYIVIVTNILLITMAILSVLGYIFIFLYSSSPENKLDGIDTTRDQPKSFDSFEENYY